MTRLDTALIFALAAAAAPAFAASEETTSAYIAPAPDYYYTPPATTYYPSSSTTVYYEPPVIVTAPPENSDQAINGDVVDTIANDSRISGRIGSDTFNGNVTLDGRVGTPFQAQLAEQDAKSVDGVNDVDNRIRPVVGEH